MEENNNKKYDMQYYSKVLNRFFDTREELEKAVDEYEAEEARKAEEEAKRQTIAKEEARLKEIQYNDICQSIDDIVATERNILAKINEYVERYGSFSYESENGTDLTLSRDNNWLGMLLNNLDWPLW